MMDEQEYAESLCFDGPIAYKGISVYPCTVRQSFEFQRLIGILTLDKRETGDAEAAAMPYLTYLYWLCKNGVQGVAEALCGIMELATREKAGCFENAKGRAILRVGDVDFSARDFEGLRRLICLQNGVELTDEGEDTEIRRIRAETRATEQRASGSSFCSLEDQLTAVSVYTGIERRKLFDLSLRTFKGYIERMTAKQSYELRKIAEGFGCKFKDKEVHWLSDLKQDDFYRSFQENQDMGGFLNG